ncbi:MAG: asparagine synthase-related protein, partial [Dehalococcoidia bacterium]
DELMGGYWWHANVSDRYTDVSAAFEDYWQRLDAEQIYPMKLSADRVGIEVSWPFLDDRVVQVISRIPVSERVKPGIPKAWWKRFAREYVGIPDGVVERQKLGFVSALTSDIGPMKVRICGEVQ